MSVRLTTLKADNGDCLFISHTGGNEAFNLLIDGGTVNTFRRPNGTPGPLRTTLDKVKENNDLVDLVILTHIDGDHIGGLKRAFETKGYLSTLTKKLWYNSSMLITERANLPEIPENYVSLDKDSNPETSYKQAFSLEELLKAENYWHLELILAGQKFNEGPFTLTTLSPREEDILKLARKWPKEYISPFTSGRRRDLDVSFPDLLKDDIFVDDPALPNRSSIAFILELGRFKGLFLADASDDAIMNSLAELGFSQDNKLVVDIVKVSHHGSLHNTSPNFLKLIETSGFLFSTNGLVHNHPDRITIARILELHPNAKLYFNYEETVNLTFSKAELNKYASHISVVKHLDFCT